MVSGGVRCWKPSEKWRRGRENWARGGGLYTAKQTKQRRKEEVGTEAKGLDE